jgi:hypothetical protein
MAFTPTFPNLKNDFNGGPVIGLADVRTSFSSTLSSIASNLPAAVQPTLASALGKANTFAASVEARLPAGNPFPPLPTNLAGSGSRRIYPPAREVIGVREVIPNQTALVENRTSGVAKQVANVYTSSGY